MSTEQQEQAVTWERLPDEPNNWYGRFLLYRDLDSPRTLLGAVHKEEAQKGAKRRSKSVPGAWFRNSERWGWKARAEAYDTAERKRVEEKKQAYIDSILKEGFALKHERVKTLSKIANKLLGYLDEEKNIWLPDVKSVGTGPNAQRVDLVRFNAEYFAEIRNHLADIAAEMGERVKQQIKQETNVNIDVTGAQRSLISKLEAFAKSDKSEPDSDKPASSDSDEQPDQS